MLLDILAGEGAVTGVIERAGRKGAASVWSAKGAKCSPIDTAQGDGPVMTRDNDYDLKIRTQRRAKRPLSTLTASLLTLVCSVALLSETAHAASRTTRELNAAAAAAAGQASEQVEGAVRNAVATGQAATDRAASPAPATERKTAAAPAPRVRPQAPATVDAPIPRTQLTARNITEQRQIQRVSTLKAQGRRWSCVPFARELTGFQISGDAWRWWDAAAGRYNRGRMPVAGSVIVLKRTGSMRRGHVAVVRRVVSSARSSSTRPTGRRAAG